MTISVSSFAVIEDGQSFGFEVPLECHKANHGLVKLYIEDNYRWVLLSCGAIYRWEASQSGVYQWVAHVPCGCKEEVL